MPHPQVHYGFEPETMEAKVRCFLKLTPAERIKSMMEFMELTRAIAQAKPRKRAQKVSRAVQGAKRRAVRSKKLY